MPRVQTRSRPSKRGFCRRAGQGQSVPPARYAEEIWFQDKARIGQIAPMRRRSGGSFPRESRSPGDGRSEGRALRDRMINAPNPPTFWGDLPTGRQSSRPRPAVLQHRYHEPAPGRDLPERRAQCHAVLFMDQAGWHLTPKLDLPRNISMIAIRSKCPELSPQENVWQFMRDNWLSNRAFGS